MKERKVIYDLVPENIGPIYGILPGECGIFAIKLITDYYGDEKDLSEIRSMVLDERSGGTNSFLTVRSFQNWGYKVNMKGADNRELSFDDIIKRVEADVNYDTGITPKIETIREVYSNDPNCARLGQIKSGDITSLIDRGIPVISVISSVSNDDWGHCVVIYGYDNSGMFLTDEPVDIGCHYNIVAKAKESMISLGDISLVLWAHPIR